MRGSLEIGEEKGVHHNNDLSVVKAIELGIGSLVELQECLSGVYLPLRRSRRQPISLAEYKAAGEVYGRMMTFAGSLLNSDTGMRLFEVG